MVIEELPPAPNGRSRQAVRGVLIVALAGLLTACGVTATFGGSPTPSLPASSDPTQTELRALMLTNADAQPATGFVPAPNDPGPNDPLKQIGDVILQPEHDQRVFSDQFNTLHIEDDILVYPSPGAATSDYGSALNGIKSVFTTLSGHTTTGLGSLSDEYLGTGTDGYDTVGIAFAEEEVIGVVLVQVASGTVDAAYAEAVARAQDQKIRAAIAGGRLQPPFPSP
jgi:hypothetical protein